MNEKYALIKIEKDAWENAKAEIMAMNKMDSEIISINVGGTKHL